MTDDRRSARDVTNAGENLDPSVTLTRAEKERLEQMDV